jgi:divalent metal cation (Fe/Co/Zn/Cd) transporter
MKRKDLYKYPAGNARLEPLGIIAFSACMFTATLQLLVAGVQVLIANDDGYLKIDILSMVILGCTVVVKGLLWLFCRTVDNESAQVLAQDHINDVFSNSFGTVMMILAKYVAWWIDPSASMIIGIYIMVTWAMTGLEQVRNLSGRTASPTMLKQLTYLVWNHDERVLQIDTVRAFHLGFGFVVEVDVVLPEDMLLKEAHDIGESLQMKLERVESVERAFVHLDYETDHSPEHQDSEKLVKLAEKS